MVHASFPHLKSERNTQKKRFTAFLVCKIALITHDPTKSVNSCIALLSLWKCSYMIYGYLFPIYLEIFKATILRSCLMNYFLT